MLIEFFKLSLFVCAINAAVIKKDDFGNENFLEKAVKVPKVHEGEAEIHTISGSKQQKPNHDAKKLDTLLRQLFNNFLTQETSNDDVKIAKNGKAYVKKKPIPNQDEKKDVSSELDTKRPEHTQSENTNDSSLKEITNSVERFLDSLNKKKNTGPSKKDSGKFKFQTVGENTDDTSKDDAYEKFKNKFIKLFLKDENIDKATIERKESSKAQGLIGTGKDPPSLIGTGKDNSRARLNKLYDELRTETAEHVEEERKKNKRERMELVKNDFLDLLNTLQKREIFTYHDGKFALVDHHDEHRSVKKSELIKKDDSVKKDEENNLALKDDSKLKTVELLVKELRDLENRKDPEKKESTANYENSMKKMENVFLEAFKKEIEKKKKKTGSEDTGKSTKRNSLRNRLLDIMDRLDQQIKDEEKRVVADEKQIKQLERNDMAFGKKISHKNSLESELDDILKEHKRSTENNWGSDEETLQALQGFNVKQEQSKSTRP